jgi:hypothetical protein
MSWPNFLESYLGIIEVFNEGGKWERKPGTRFSWNEKGFCGSANLMYLDKNKEYQGVKNLVIYSSSGNLQN